jgi:hypothetical protein
MELVTFTFDYENDRTWFLFAYDAQNWLCANLGRYDQVSEFTLSEAESDYDLYNEVRQLIPSSDGIRTAYKHIGPGYMMWRTEFFYMATGRMNKKLAFIVRFEDDMLALQYKLAMS